jgi:hypothetical protein
VRNRHIRIYIHIHSTDAGSIKWNIRVGIPEVFICGSGERPDVGCWSSFLVRSGVFNTTGAKKMCSCVVSHSSKYHSRSLHSLVVD